MLFNKRIKQEQKKERAERGKSRQTPERLMVGDEPPVTKTCLYFTTNIYKNQDLKPNSHKKIVNARFNLRNNRIIINPEAKSRSHEMVLIHELTHAIYNTKDGVLQVAEGLKSMSAEEKENIRKRYSKVGQSSAVVIADEINAHFAEQTLSNKNILERLVADKPTVKERIIDFFKGAKSDYDGDVKLTKAAEKLYKQYKKLFDEFSARNYQNNAADTQADKIASAKAQQATQTKTQKNASVENIKYAQMNNKSFSENVKDIATMSDEEALYRKSQDNYIKVMDETPAVITKNVKDAENLEVVMKFEALYLSVRKDGAFNKENSNKYHYHNLGVELATKLPEYISDPEAIIRVRAKNGTERLNLLTTVQSQKGNNGIISIELGTVKDINNKHNKYNLIVTAFSADDNYTRNTIDGAIRVEYEKNDLSQVNHQLHKWLASINEKSLNRNEDTGKLRNALPTNSISNPNEKVNPKTENSSEKDTKRYALPETDSDIRYALPETLNKLGDYDSVRAERITSRNGDTISRNYEEIISFIKNAKSGDPDTRLHIGIINNDTAAHVKEKTGIDITDYELVLSSSNIVHIFNRHGKSTESLSGQIQVTYDNIENIIEAVIDPENVYLDTDNSNNTGIVFEKNINGKNVAITVVSTKKSTLTLKSAWIMKSSENTPSANAEARARTSETNSRQLAANSISDTEEKSNTKTKKSSKNIRYALSEETNSDGTLLTEEQSKYFKKSKARDEQGNLLVLYNGGFYGTVYSGRNNSYNKNSIYLTDNPFVASAYAGRTNAREAATHSVSFGDTTIDETVKELYANIENPIILDAKGHNYTDIPISDNAPQSLKDYFYDTADADNLPVYAEKYGYDGVIIKNVKEGVGGEAMTEVIALKANQVKLTSNESPTTNDDIRFALPEDDKARNLSAGQVKKSLANYTQDKMYTKAQSEQIVNSVLASDALFFDNSYGYLEKKSRNAVINTLWESLNTAKTQAEVEKVANDTADYIIQSAVLESIIDELAKKNGYTDVIYHGTGSYRKFVGKLKNHPFGYSNGV